jgi:hypothetical protein
MYRPSFPEAPTTQTFIDRSASPNAYLEYVERIDSE